ncbi:MAG: MoaD/ThiS family protein [Anaerolineae bacterium]|nr:MoaD/ThiS family protein [Anaerolineae bacterium]
MIQVKVFSPVWEHPGSSLDLDLEGRPVSVVNLLQRLEIDPAEVGIVTVDGRQSRLGDVISEDSRVCIFPPMFGG